MTSPEMNFAVELTALNGDDTLTLRNAASALIRTCLANSRKAAEAKLLKDGKGTACAEALSFTQDEIIKGLFAFASQRLQGAKSFKLAVVAVGGYGRGTLAP